MHVSWFFVAGCFVASAACVAYLWAQRSLVTGRCVHWNCGHRSQWLITTAVSYELLAALTLMLYEAQHSGLLGEGARGSPVLCYAVIWLGHTSTALFVTPYVLRTFRLAALFKPSLRRRFWFAATDAYVQTLCTGLACRCVTYHDMNTVHPDPTELLSALL